MVLCAHACHVDVVVHWIVIDFVLVLITCDCFFSFWCKLVSVLMLICF